MEAQATSSKNHFSLGILLMIGCTLFTTLGQIFYKYASFNFEWSFLSLLLNYYLWIGLLSYGFGAGLLIIALKFGKLSVLYPLVALTYIWVTVISLIWFKEPLTFYKILGIFFVVGGTILIGRGGRR